MKKDIVCIVVVLAFGAIFVPQAEGINRIMKDLLVMSKDTFTTVFQTMDTGLNNTKQLITSCVDTLLASEITQPVSGIQDTQLKAALEGLTSRFVTLCNELQHPVKEAQARIGSMQTTTASCETSLQKVCDDLIGRVGQCSSRRINTAISQMHNCVNDGMDHITGEIMGTKRILNEVLAEFKDLLRKRRDCLVKVDAARCLSEIMRDILPQFFMNTQKRILTIIEVRPTMEPLRICTSEIVTDVPRVC